jgi:hypothetical protein
MIKLRDQFTNAMAGQARTMTSRLERSDGLSVQQWEAEMRVKIKTARIAQSVLGHGGRKTMTPSEWGRVGSMMRKQYEYLSKFAADLAEIATGILKGCWTAGAPGTGRACTWTPRSTHSSAAKRHPTDSTCPAIPVTVIATV